MLLERVLLNSEVLALGGPKTGGGDPRGRSGRGQLKGRERWPVVCFGVGELLLDMLDFFLVGKGLGTLQTFFFVCDVIRTSYKQLLAVLSSMLWKSLQERISDNHLLKEQAPDAGGWSSDV